jgi:chlorobactene glucosyltransferase
MFIAIILSVVALLSVLLYIRLRHVLTLFSIDLSSLPKESLDTLPAVSLCIPARDEVHAMTTCLENALSSNYPKLEIIVLDDGSRDNTGHLIKSFAHSGVRFVEGSPLPDGWLGKNHALEGLLKESSGTYILFVDVDTQFSPDSISQMMTYMMRTKSSMLSVMPYRSKNDRISALFATLRHFWNIIGHTKVHPAVASNAWMVKRSDLEESFESFATIAQDVRPERTIAEKLKATGRYRFIVSSPSLGISYEKKLSSQYETSLRIYYPEFGLVGILLRVAGLAVFLAPFMIFSYGLITREFVDNAISFCIAIMVTSAYMHYLKRINAKINMLTYLILPLVMIREIGLLFASVLLYKIGRVTWKGRPVASKR